MPWADTQRKLKIVFVKHYVVATWNNKCATGWQNKLWHVRPAKTQIRLGGCIRPAWLESSLCAQKVANAPSFFMRTAESRLISLGWCPGRSESSLGANVKLLVLSCRGSNHSKSLFKMLIKASVVIQTKNIDDLPESVFLGISSTKTCLYNFDPLKHHFYRVKLGFTGVYIIFLIFARKHRLWVLVRTASPRRF